MQNSFCPCSQQQLSFSVFASFWRRDEGIGSVRLQPWTFPSLALPHPCCLWYLRTWAVASQRCLGACIFSRHTPPKLKSPGGTNISPGLHDVLHQPLFLALGRATSLTSAMLECSQLRDVPAEGTSLVFSVCPFLLSEYNHHFSWYSSIIYEM